MTTYITLLRGINVSGKNKLKMADLRAMLQAMSLQNIQTYIQSGNIIFDSESDKNDLATSIQNQILTTFNYQVAVQIFTLKAWQQIIQNNPFTPNIQDISKLHLTLLGSEPSPETLQKIRDIPHPTDRFILHQKAIYLHCPNGYGRTKFTNNFFEKKLQTTATTRNWKTTLKLLELATS